MLCTRCADVPGREAVERHLSERVGTIGTRRPREYHAQVGIGRAQRWQNGSRRILSTLTVREVAGSQDDHRGD